MRTVDFSRPTKFTTDHQRRIERALDTFCQTAATRLSAELRWPIELEAINTTQATWSAAQALLPQGCLAVMIDVQPIGTRMLLTAEQTFVLTAVECLLGGSPDRPPRERRLTEIDWSLTRRLFESMVTQLSLVWQDLGRISLAAGEIELHNDTGQIASVSEPTLVVVIESRINKQSSALSLLIPWIVDRARRAADLRPRGAEHRRRRGTGGGHRAGDDGRAGYACAPRSRPWTWRSTRSSRSSPEAWSAWASKPQDGVALFAENMKIAQGHPGANGAKRAVQIRQPEVIS